jgi:hypothetical protein
MRQVLPILTQEQRDTLKRLRDESKQRRQEHSSSERPSLLDRWIDIHAS